MTEPQYYPPMPPPQYPMWEQPRNDKHKGLAIASLTLGIIAILFGFIPILFFLAWILAVIGLVFGFVAIRHGIAKTGVILSFIAVALGLWGLTIVVSAAHDFNHCVNSIQTDDNGNVTDDCHN